MEREKLLIYIQYKSARRVVDRKTEVREREREREVVEGISGGGTSLL